MTIPLIAAGDVVQCVYRQRLDNQIYMNVLHYVCDEVGTAGTYEEEINEIDEALNNGVGSLLNKMLLTQCTELVMEETQLQVIHPNRRPYFVFTYNDPGLVEGPAAPGAVTLSITKRVEVAGQGRAGHFQLAGQPQEEMENGLWNSGQIALAQTLANQMEIELNTATGGVYFPCVYSPTSAGGFNYLIQCIAKAEIRTMSRRVVGRGI